MCNFNHSTKIKPLLTFHFTSPPQVKQTYHNTSMALKKSLRKRAEREREEKGKFGVDGLTGIPWILINQQTHNPLSCFTHRVKTNP